MISVGVDNRIIGSVGTTRVVEEFFYLRSQQVCQEKSTYIWMYDPQVRP